MQMVLTKRGIAAVLALVLIGALYVFASGDASREALPQVSAASVDYFLKIPGVPGESTDEGHKDWINLLSYSWGMSNSGGATGGGGGAGKASFGDITFVKEVDKSTPLLLEACADGRNIRDVQFNVRKPGAATDFYSVRLEGARCSVLQQEGDQSTPPTEEVAFYYNKITFEYYPQDKKGAIGEPVIREVEVDGTL